MAQHGRLFINALLFLFLFLSFIPLFVSGHGLFFFLELMGILFLLFLLLVAFATSQHKAGQALFVLVALFYIINILLLWAYRGELALIPLIVAVLTFAFTLTGIQKDKKKLPEEPHSVVFDSPSSYVAGKTSSLYHKESCDWVKRIKKERRVTFTSTKEAEEQGFTPHGCVSS